MEAPPNINLKATGHQSASAAGDGEPKTQKDLVDLSRRYRVLENERRGFADDVQRTIRRQTQAMERLTNENNQLRERVAEATHRAGGSQARQAEAEALLAKKAAIEARIAGEREALRALERKLRVADRAVDDLRRTKAFAEAARPTAAAVDQQARLLENRLETTTRKYNGLLAGNRALRDEIEHLRSEHLSFERMHAGLLADADAKARLMEALMGQAREEFRAREALQEQLARLRETAAKEAAAFQDEWAELGRVLERDARRRQLQQQQLEQQRQHLEDQANSKLSASLRQAEAASESSARLLDEQAYEHAFRTIVASGCYPQVTAYVAEAQGLPVPSAGGTGGADGASAEALAQALERVRITEGLVRQIADVFIASEEQNFSLFNFSNDLRAELEGKEEDLFRIRSDLQASKKRKGDQDASLKSEVSALEVQLATIRQTGESLGARCQTLSSSMAAVYELVELMYKEAGCERLSGVSTMNDAVESNFVTSENVILHLSAVESAVDSMVAKLIMMIGSGGIPRERVAEIVYTDVPEDVRMSLAPAATALLRAATRTGDDSMAMHDFGEIEA